MHLWWCSRAHKSEQRHAKPAKPRPAPCRLWWSGGCGVASLCARSRGEPSSAHCEQRLSERLTPCPCDPVCACTGMRGHAAKGKSRPSMHRGAKAPCISVSDPRSAASRAGMAGWAGEGGGRFGERREYEAPTLPSTPRQHGMARHHTRQPGNVSTTRLDTPPQRPAEKPHATTQARQATPAQLSKSHSSLSWLTVSCGCTWS